jgi:two-component system, NarL family, invasion response regulator UvrY
MDRVHPTGGTDRFSSVSRTDGPAVPHGGLAPALGRGPAGLSPRVPYSDGLTRDYEIILGMPDRLISQSLEWTISSLGQAKRVRSIHQIDDLVSVVSTEMPRVVLLDEQFCGPQLQTLARQIPVRLGDSVIAALADRLSCRQLQMTSGYVNGLLSRHAPLQTFMSELDVVASGRKIVSTSLQSRVVLNARQQFEVVSLEKIQNLTNRQLEVLIRIAEGMTAKEAAQDLHVTEKAIESHKYRLMRILGVRDRIELCRWAIREGIIASN